MYPGDGDPPEDSARGVSNWIEALTGASSSEAWIQNYHARPQGPSSIIRARGRCMKPTYINIRGAPYRAELLEADGGSRVRIYPEAD
ncbi:hypothetical protein BHMPCIPO_06370 [Ensifer sesbaniae]|nr:hypothetical protein [Ensifer sesbaniae]